MVSKPLSFAGNKQQDTGSLVAGVLVSELVSAWNAHDVERIALCHAKDYQMEDIAAARPLNGRTGARLHALIYLRAFPDVVITADGLIANGEQVGLLWTAKAHHRGLFMQIPATGRAVTMKGITWMTLRDDLVWRAVRIWDLAGLLRQLGLLPDL